jgi:hypothetical protein
MGFRWSKQDERVLEWLWCTEDCHRIAKRLGRSQRAVVDRARVLGLGPQRRGTMTLSEIEKATGYPRTRIKTAAVHIGIELRRVPRSDPKNADAKHPWFAISPEDRDKLLEYLSGLQDGKRIYQAQQGTWGGPRHRGGTKPQACIDCGRNDVPHFCRGRCRRCDGRWRKSLSKNRAQSPENSVVD